MLCGDHTQESEKQVSQASRAWQQQQQRCVALKGSMASELATGPVPTGRGVALDTRRHGKNGQGNPGALPSESVKRMEGEGAVEEAKVWSQCVWCIWSAKPQI